jgi:hypothetical protein
MAAVLGALELYVQDSPPSMTLLTCCSLLTVVILTIFSRNLHKHRRVRSNAVFGTSQTTGSYEEKAGLSVTASTEPEGTVSNVKV